MAAAVVIALEYSLGRSDGPRALLVTGRGVRARGFLPWFGDYYIATGSLSPDHSGALKVLWRPRPSSTHRSGMARG